MKLVCTLKLTTFITFKSELYCTWVKTTIVRLSASTEVRSCLHRQRLSEKNPSSKLSLLEFLNNLLLPN